MSEIILSVCIPTYNRADFLTHLLEQAAEDWNFNFSYEIIISDNGSTDGTATAVEKYIKFGLPIEYHVQDSNLGMDSNILTVFHRARGQYILYLADDDLLIPTAVEETLNFLRLQPDLRAAYAPWQMFDDVNKVSVGIFYELQSEYIFKPEQSTELFNFIIHRHIFPEIAIFRADAIRRTLTMPRFCFWPFTILADTIADGPVAFLRTPYYLSVVNSPLRQNRTQAGVEQAMTDWDTYRGGLEYFIFAMQKHRWANLSRTDEVAAQGMIDSFIARRMQVALRLWLERGEYLNAYDIFCRLSYRDPELTVKIPGIDRLSAFLILQKLTRFVGSVGGIARLEIIGIEQNAALLSNLRSVGLSADIAVNLSNDTPQFADPERTVVFIDKECLRNSCLDAGFLPNLIISSNDLTRGIYI